MISCAVYGCSNTNLTTDPSVHYHPFPTTVIALQWVQACGCHNSPINVTTAHVCSKHFDESAYDTEIKMVNLVAYYKKTLKYDAIPTLYLPQTQIIIRDSSTELENVKGIVVYTITPTNENENIASISLQDDTGENQFFQFQSSSSDLKTETQADSNESDKYDRIKNYPDLYVLQAHNKSLKRKMEAIEEEITNLEQTLETKENDYQCHEKESTQLKARIARRNVFTQQEQKVILSKVFSESQIKILFGKKKTYWSNDDMAVGYTIRHLSNKRCYAYLTKTLKYPLPAVSSVKRWITTKKGQKSECVKKDEKKKFAKID